MCSLCFRSKGGLMEKFLEILQISGKGALIILGIWLFLNIIGEILELKGRIVPEFINIRKFFKRKKEEKRKEKQLLQNVEILLAEVNTHYSADNIAKRDEWMTWVNNRAQVYDAALNDLTAMKDSIEHNNQLTLDLYININRNRIIDFARIVANEDKLISKEEFNRIFKIHTEYENVLAAHHMTNGEVDIAYKIIKEAYQERLRDNTFLEDIRGYN